MSLRIENIKKSFFQGDLKIDVLKGLSAEVQNGETVAVVGQSGSGKSTLLSILAGLERIDSGEIWIAGKKISDLTEQDITKFRAENISIVFQQYHLVGHLTALENVMLPLEIFKKTAAKVRAETLLEEMGLAHRFHHRPSQLSGGECQRVAIARALVVEPKILLADEPSGNLDVETGGKVIEKFFEIINKHKTTTLLVTHSENLARKCHRILNLQKGQFTNDR
jgi:putative ABC transport system ATP-binding protein